VKIDNQEKCPQCSVAIVLKLENDSLRMFNPDGTWHTCGSGYVDHPIGQAVEGKVVTDFQLRGRVLTLTLEDGNILSVSAAGRPLSIRLEGPTGITQE
jgi:hypothetical protein